jgi:alpha-glucan phosphorylase-like protein
MKLRRVFIHNDLPAALAPLHRLSHNIWWSWSADAQEMFKSIDPERFVELNYNPVALLETLDPARAQELAKDKAFLQQLKSVERDFDAYLAEPKKKGPKIAYFSMEYGLHISLKLYSGGLGVLAGDYLKEASDSNVDLFGVGLLYRYGYFNQGLSINGDQIHKYPAQKFTQLPVEPVRDAEGNFLKITVPIQGRIVVAKVWKLPIGRINLYLLDTDHEDNQQDDRALSHMLYGGDNEHRLKQEILLGIGGVRAIEAMDLRPEVYHLNEGHAGFLSIERLKTFIRENGLSFREAVEAVRASSLYTTHTPVPAGHDHFPEHLLRNYLYSYAAELGISWEEFVALGRKDPNDAGEDFNMSKLSIALSQRVNGVSKLHGEVSQEMFTTLYPGYVAEEVHIGYVTNSVHYPTWIANELHKLYSRVFGKDWVRDQSNKDIWRKISKIDDKELFDVQQHLKVRLLDYVRTKLEVDMRKRGESPRVIFDILSKIDNNALVLGFARRFATYKRATLLFQDENRLRELVSQEGRPVIFLFAGKAHPADQGGQDLIRHIVHVSKKPEFAGKVIFLEDYNMEMAKLLTQGVDIWLNTPTRPLEASGTSGMKAALNGRPNFSVLDGWWAEGYRPDAGWALPLERTYEEQHLQNELDAELIYHTMEEEIIPIYFDRDKHGISKTWMGYVKQIIAEVAPTFTMKRMMDDYYERFYFPLGKSQQATSKNNYKLAKEYAAWKQNVTERWNGIEVAENHSFDSVNQALPTTGKYEAEVVIDTNGIDAKDLTLELCGYRRKSETKLELIRIVAFKLKGQKDGHTTFTVSADPQISGVFEFGFRLRPVHKLMPHAQDLNLVFWA